MMNKTHILILSSLLTLTGCMNGPNFLEQSNDSNQRDKDVVVESKAVEDIEGAIVGEFSATSQSAQILSADQNSAVQGATISIAPNSLAIDTNITIQEGAAIASDSVIQQVSGDSSLGISSSANAVNVSSDQTVDLAQPMTVQLSIPDTASLTAGDLSSLVVFYKVYKKSEGIWVHGFLAKDKLSVASSFVSFAIQHFGTFQAVFLTSPPAQEAKEVTSSSSAISKKDEKSLPPVVWGVSSTSFDAATRSVSVSMQVKGHQELEFCEVFADGDQLPPYDIRANTGGSLATTLRISSESALNLAFKWSCAEKNGRLSQSDWSEKLSIPEAPKNKPQTNQSPVISFSAPSAAGQLVRLNASYAIAFSASDADDVAAINLYYSSSSAGCAPGLSGWTKIVAGLKEGVDTGYTWNMAGVAAGSYFICGHINDGRGGEAYAVSSGSLTVVAPPTVALSSAQSNPTNASIVNMTVQFSHDVTGFDIGDITVTNGTKSGFAAVSGRIYTFNIGSPTGAVSVSIAAGAANDAAGNPNSASSPFTIVFDNMSPGVTITSAQSSPTNVSTINMTVAFSEDVSGFSLSDIVVGNGTKQNFVAVSATTYTFDIVSPLGTVTVDIPGGSATDAAGNASLAATQFAIVFDNTSPTAAITSSQSSPTSSTTINMTVQFSESVTGFDLTDIAVVNGTKGNFVAVDTDTYTFDITAPSGTVTVDVGASKAQDAAGNGNSAATQFSIVYDGGIPSVVLSAAQTSPTNAATINLTAQFSEVVTGFDLTDITVANGAKGNFVAVDGDTYTFDITAPTGTVTVDIASNVAQDGALNGNTAATQFSIVHDSTDPTVVLSATQASPTNSSTINMTVQFSEVVTGFDLTDITVANGTKGNFVAVDGDTYTFDITSPTGTVTVDVAGGVAQDAATNGNTAAAQFSIVYDNSSPTVVLSATQTSPTNSSIINMTVQFSEVVSGFTLSDITVSNGSKGNFVVVDGDTYTFDITAPTGTVTVDVGGGVAQDSATNGNTAASQFSIVYDNSSPTVVLSAAQTSPTNASTINMTAQFSEAVTGFDLTDITVANGTKGNFVAVDGDTYTFDITSPSATVTVDVAGGVAQDSATNGNTAATQFSIVYDNTVPTVTLSAAQSSPTNSATINMTVLFSETVTGFDLADIVVTGGTKGNFVAVDGFTYTFDITAPAATVTVDVSAAVANDLAGNPNAAATQFSILYDNVAPDVAITTTQGSPTNASTINVTVQFTENVTGFTLGDATVSGGTPVNFVAVDGDTYTFDVTSLTSNLSISVGVGVANDSAGNGNTSSSLNIVTGPALVGPGLQEYTINTVISSVPFGNSGASAVSCSVAPAMPAGIVISNVSGSCQITGTPTEALRKTTFSVTGTAANGVSNTVAVDITVRFTGEVSAKSPKRIAFYDSATSKHWVVFRNGSNLEFSSSTDGVTWIEAGSDPVSGDDFAVAAKGGKAVVASKSGYDIGLRRFDLTTLPVTLIGSTLTLMTGSMPSNEWSMSAVTIGDDNKIYVAGYQARGVVKVPGMVVSANTFEQTSQSFGSPHFFGVPVLVAEGISLVPYSHNSNKVLAVIKGQRDSVLSYAFNGASWTELRGDGKEWWSEAPFGLNGTVRAVAVIGSDIYVGGQFTDAGGDPNADKIARWDGAAWHPVGGPADNTVLALAVIGTDLYAAGTFSNINGVPANSVAKWNGTTWSALGTGLNGPVYAMTVSGGNLYVGGGFTTAGGNPANRVAKWSGSSWSALGAGVSDNYVFAITTIGASVYVGGNFTSAGAVSNTTKIAKYSGGAWYALGSGITSGLDVAALATNGSDLFVGGNFTDQDGIGDADHIARWNGSAWSALGTGMTDAVKTLRVDGNDLYAGGNFGMAGGVTANKVARWNGSSWSALQNGVSSIVWALDFFGSDLIVGGDFTTANSVGASNIAQYSTGIVAKAKSFSLAGHSPGATLAYIDGGNQKPYYKIFNGTSWGSGTMLSAESYAAAQIQVATTGDNSRFLFVWDTSDNHIKYQSYNAGWSGITILSNPGLNAVPWVPARIDAAEVPVFWSRTGPPDKVEIGTVIP